MHPYVAWLKMLSVCIRAIIDDEQSASRPSRDERPSRRQDGARGRVLHAQLHRDSASSPGRQARFRQGHNGVKALYLRRIHCRSGSTRLTRSQARAYYTGSLEGPIMAEYENKQIDKRVVQRYIRKGKVDDKEYDLMQKKLPDLSDQAVSVEVAFDEDDPAND